MSEWINCKKAIPNNINEVLILEDMGDGDLLMHVARYIRLKNGNDYWRSIGRKISIKNCTHWMQLPDFPKE